jgi:hypothetical protein
VSHEENENCLTLEKSIHIKDLVNGFGHDGRRFFQGIGISSGEE